MRRILNRCHTLHQAFLSTQGARPKSTQTSLSPGNSSPDAKAANSPELSFTNTRPDTPKTQLQTDAELQQKLEEISGGGGEAGLELENGKPVAMKRGVKENMFRLI